MKRVRVKSSNIASVGYDAEALLLEVEFIGGAVYRYAGVPAKVHRALMGSESIGVAFHKLVRPNFKAELSRREEAVSKRAEVVTQCAVRGCPELASTVIGEGNVDGRYVCSKHATKSLPKGHIKAHRVVRAGSRRP